MFLYLSVILFTGWRGCHDVTSCYGQHHPSQRMASPRTAHPLHAVNRRAVRILLECFLVTIRNKVAARLHLSVILFTGGWVSASVHAGIHPLGQTPPQKHTPQKHTAPRKHSPQKHTPLETHTTSPEAHPPEEHTSPPQEAHSPRSTPPPPRKHPPPETHTTPLEAHPRKHPHTHPEAHPPTVTAADGTHLVLFYSSLEMSLFM